MFKAVSALALVSLTSSCVAVVAGAAAAVGYVMYSENEAYRDFETDLDETWDATIDALQSLDYQVDSDYPHGVTEGEIDLEDRETTVAVKLYPEGFTRVSVRVGTFESDDNKRKAELILEAVAKQL